MKALGTMVGKITPLALFGAEAIHADGISEIEDDAAVWCLGYSCVTICVKCVYFGAL